MSVDVGAGVRGERVDAGSLGPDDLDAWGSLAERAADPNPFLRPEFVVANMVERAIPVQVLVVRDDRHWLACLPVRFRPPSLRFPFPYLEALTDEYSLCGTPLIDGGRLTEASTAFMDLVFAEPRNAALVIGQFAPDGPAGTALAAAATLRGMRPIAYEDYERAAWRWDPGKGPGARLKRSTRRELARRSKLLRSELDGELEIVDRTNDPAAWDAYLAMENSGWKSERGTALASTSADAAFFRRMCAGMAAVGCLDIVALEAGGRTVAMECHLVDGTTLYSLKIAHDPEFRKYSPGTQLKYRVIERLHDQGYMLGDSCADPKNVHMNRLWPDRRRMQTLILPTGAPRGRLVRPATSIRSAVRRVRRGLRSSGPNQKRAP